MRRTRELLAALMLTAPWTQTLAQPQPLDFADRAKAALTKVETRCLQAKHPRELDRLWAELAALKSNTDPRQDSSLHMQLDGAILFVGKWREYLEAHGLGNKTAAFKILEQLLADHRWLTLIRRSEVLKRSQEAHSFYTVRYSTKTLDDLPKVIAALEKLERLTDHPGGMNKSLKPFLELQELWASREDRNWNRLESACRIEPDDRADESRFKLLILSHVLAGYLNLDKKYHVPPQEGETAPAYLAARITQAIQEGDLRSLWRMKTYLGFLAKDRSSPHRQEIQALDLCLEGQKYETQGKNNLATACYRHALECLGAGSVLAFATNRLREIESTDPAAFTEGTQQWAEILRRTRPNVSRSGSDRAFRAEEREDPELWRKY